MSNDAHSKTAKELGAFDVAERKEREGRNLQTGKPMKIVASKSPRFKAGKALKDAVNGNK